MRYIIPASILVLAALTAVVSRGRNNPSVTSVETAMVRRGPLKRSSVYDGTVSSRRVETIMSRSGGAAVIAHLAEDGYNAAAGDVVARLDSSGVEREVLRLKREYRMAASALSKLENAEIPLELSELRLKVSELLAACEDQERFLRDTVELHEEDLVSDEELRQQEAEVAKLRRQLKATQLTLDLTQQYLHPAALEQARATVDAAQRELDIAVSELENCVIRSPISGVLSYLSLHVGSEFRVARVGDTIYRNQPFMAVCDMSDLVVHCHVPETELPGVSAGCEATIRPFAYPLLRLKGEVAAVSTTAQSVPGRPNWQKCFRVTIAVAQSPAELRVGMSAHVKILAPDIPDVCLLPRRCVFWRSNESFCTVMEHGQEQERPVRLGHSSLTDFEVRSGVRPGETVAVW